MTWGRDRWPQRRRFWGTLAAGAWAGLGWDFLAFWGLAFGGLAWAALGLAALAVVGVGGCWGATGPGWGTAGIGLAIAGDVGAGARANGGIAIAWVAARYFASLRRVVRDRGRDATAAGFNCRETKIEPAVHVMAIAPNNQTGTLPLVSKGWVATAESEPTATADTLRRSAALGLSKLPNATTPTKKTDIHTPPQKAIGRVCNKCRNHRSRVEGFAGAGTAIDGWGDRDGVESDWRGGCVIQAGSSIAAIIAEFY